MSDFIDRIRQLSPQRLALLAIELNTRLEAAEAAQNDPIAVIGLGLRFPGGAHDARSYWDLLSAGVDAIQEIPASRFDINAYYDPDPDKPGKINTRWGGFVEPVDQFEPQLFGITPREAMTMDPQQRLVLEVAWEALENAGYAPDRLNGTKTGVFLGASNNDYYQILLRAGDQAADMYLATGNAHSVLSGRVSYILGLQGPSLTIDTACSSSLSAIHTAYLSLKKGECRIALAGGVNVILSPDVYLALARARMLAPDGRCKAFDASGNGFVRSEGCGILVLKRLSHAKVDGDRILAVLRGSAMNQDGRSNGLTAPNGPSQVSVIRAALAEARLTPADISYIETHGTGTSLGDPIEVQAIGEALGPGHSSQQPVWIGSAKTNLGHLESAAGVAGAIKLILALQHRQIPPSIHFHQPNPYIAWDRLPVRVNTQLTPWQPINGRWIGGVSSFGFSGTNVHMIFEAPPEISPEPNPVDRSLHLLRLSARTASALKAQAERVALWMAENPQSALEDVAFTLNSGRASQQHRMALTAGSLEEARLKLSALEGANGAQPQIVSGTAPSHHPRVTFLYTGSGSQWVGMGQQLYTEQPVFRKALEQCAELFKPHLSMPLLDVLYPQPGSPSPLDTFLYSQAAIFSIEYALTELWKSWGIVPDAVMGHSLGEYAAAVTAGVMSLADGVRLVAARGRLIESLPEEGMMAAVFAPLEQVEAALRSLSDQVSVAAINGPESIVISGTTAAVEAVLARLLATGVKSRRLAISRAAHSPLINPVLDEFEQIAAGIQYAAPQIDLISGLLGRQVQDEVCSARYWRRHLREPVQFTAGIQALHASNRVFIEIGPNPVLVDMAKRFLPENGAVWLHSLNKGKSDWAVILENLAAAYVNGANVDWAGFDHPYRRRRLALPTYPFERQRYWIAANRRTGVSRVTRESGAHPLLERQIQSPSLTDTVFETRISQDMPEFISHHRVFGVVILPSPAFLEMAWTAAERVFGPGFYPVENFSVQAALEIPDEGERTVQVIVKPAQNNRAAFQIFSLDENTGNWTLHASGDLLQSVTSTASNENAPFQVEAVQARCPSEIVSHNYYTQLAGLGLEFGSNFRGIEHIWRRDGEALSRVCLPTDLETEAADYHFHPAFLDACFHLLGAAISGDLDKAYLLIGIERFHLYRSPGRMLWCHTEIQANSNVSITASCKLYDEAGQLVAEVSGLLLKRAGREAMLRSMKKLPDDWLYRLIWREAALPATADDLPSSQALAAALLDTAAHNESEPDYAAYARLSPMLDQFSAMSIAQALEKLGFSLVPGQTFTLDELAHHTAILPRYARLLPRMLEILTEQGLLREASGCWTVTGYRLPSAPEIDAMIRAFPAYASEITLLARCASSLAEVLRGEQDPLALLFPKGSLESTEALYGQSPYARAFNALIAQAVSKRIPQQGELRILEVGAGTGATTANLLPLLPAGRTHYTFSDISPLFLAKAKETFRAYPFVNYQTFDVERAPQSQGFAEQSYDIILAANVLHATADLSRSLTHLRQLLKPGGLLLILESIRKESWVDLTFGLTEGWWRFEDTHLRADHPILSRTRWLALLAENGYTAATSLPGEEIGSISGQELFLAQAPMMEKTTSGSWLVFADRPAPERPSLGEALANRLRQRGESCLLVTPGAETRSSEQGWQINPQDAAAYHQVMAQTDSPVRGVIYLWGLEPDADCLTPALYLAQALKARQQATPPAVWLVTRGQQPVNETTAPIDPSAALWGFGRTLRLESPELGGGMLDLDPEGSPDTNLEFLMCELFADQDEDQIAYRAERRYIARLERTAAPAAQSFPWKADASYLITGGLGGLGLKAAQYFAQHGARHLVLLSRKGLPPRGQWLNLPPESDPARKVQAVQAIEALGAKVYAPAADVSDPAAMTALFQQFGTALPPLRGILHAAADLSSCLIEEMDAPTLQSMLRPKVNGTLLLHNLSLEHSLDFFVMFSSTTALLGSHYLAHYAAANSFLDAFAHYRRSLGLPALSINWGTWEIMRFATQAQQDRVAQFGLNQMPSDTALELLEALMLADPGAQITAAAVNWDTLKTAYEARRRRPLLENVENLRKATRAAQPEPKKAAGPSLVERVQAARAEDRYHLLADFVREQVAQVIGSARTSTIDDHQGLFEMGLDSLMSVELKSRLEAGIGGETLPSTLTFNYPSVAELAGYLLERLTPTTHDGEVVPATSQPPAAAAIAGQMDEVDDLSEEDLERLLIDTLKNNRRNDS